MKKILLLGAIALSFNSFGQVPNYAPTNGLVGWWPFNGNANDESVNTNDGVVNGATLTADRFGTPNEAYSFDGIDDFIEIPNVSDNTFENDFTISLWCNFNDFNNHYPHLIYGENGFISINGNGPAYSADTNRISGYQGPITPASSRRTPAFHTATKLSTNVNYHLIILKRNTVAYFYLNGVIGDSIVTDNSLALPIGNYLQVGSGYLNTSNYSLHGVVDDIGVWNRALTVCEIQDLYTSQLNSTSVSAGSDQIICNGDPITLSASNSMNYSWDNGITDGVAFNPTSTQDYIVDADSAGCISSDVVTITVNQPSTNTINETATDTYTSPSGLVYTTSGVYNDTILNSNQCDSIITINLTVEYAGIKEFSSSLVNIYPNPSSDNFRIIGIEKLKNVKTFEITSITGARVAKRDIYCSIIDISSLDKGIYLFVISHENGTEKIRFIKD